MTHYRLYFLGKGGGVEAAEDLNFSEDGAAIAAIEALETDHGLDLWCGPRWVRAFPGDDPAKTPGA